MSVLSTFKTFWQGNLALNTALPATKIFLDYVPEGTAFPYCRFTVLASVPTLVTSQPHIETFSYQLAFFHTDFDALNTLGETVIGVLDQAYITAATLINTRVNRIMSGEYESSQYVYSYLVEYDWSQMEG